MSDRLTEIAIAGTRLHDAIYYSPDAKAILDALPDGVARAFGDLQDLVLRKPTQRIAGTDIPLPKPVALQKQDVPRG